MFRPHGSETLGVQSPLCFLELNWQIHIEWQSKHNYINVIYKVLYTYTNTLYIT